MPRQCGCSGGQCDPSTVDVTRREFLKALGVGAIAASGGALAGAADGAPAPPGGGAPGSTFTRYPMTRPRVYAGDNLGAVAMPIGGIGTGTIWLDGQGRLRVWQIFNNHSEVRVPGSFLAVRVQRGGEAPVVRVLQTEPEPGFDAFPSLTFEGGYPIARLNYETGLPVSVTLDALNPLIPTDVANSSLPCAIFRVSVRNDSERPVAVSVLASLQNAVGYTGDGEIMGTAHRDLGRNRNQLVRSSGMTAIGMATPPEPPWPGYLRPRRNTGELLEGPPSLWLGELGGAVETAARGSYAMAGMAALAGAASGPGMIVASGATEAFFASLARAAGQLSEDDYVEVFEDFERADYEGWTVEGDCFGPGPSHGTEANQQQVTGFRGLGLVNTFRPGDAPQGRLTSRAFTVTRNYIGFLIGGGAHSGETCINLIVDGRVVRTATGRNNELLEPRSWDVREFLGREARIEIVDTRSDGWGHINIDHIVFADAPLESLGVACRAFNELAARFPLQTSGAETVAVAGVGSAIITDPILAGAEEDEPWVFESYIRLPQPLAGTGVEVLAQTFGGDPVLVRVPYGEASLAVAMAPDMPWSWAKRLFASALGVPAAELTFEPTRPGYGSMALSTDAEAAADVAWTDPAELARRFRDTGTVGGSGTDSGLSDPGTTWNGALAVSFGLEPREERTASFVITWHFANVERFGHQGNHYCEVFADALDAASYVCRHLAELTERTELYHRTVYESNIPEEFLDAITSQSVIVRGPTCWRSADGYFGGFEGAYGCCPLNCTHVWNYAQTHARLFPEIGRNMRVSDFITWLHESGETSHRQLPNTYAFADGHCACIVAALREHQLSADDGFLRRLYPNVKKAMDWFIQRYDPSEEGVTRTHQWNTYDTAVSGLNTFIGSQYLSALAACEEMALLMDDHEPASRWRRIRLAGAAKQDGELWNGEYYIQIPEQPPAHDYNNGCHSDQLLGQWWAHQLGLGRLYPEDHVRSALAAIYRHNLKRDFTGLPQIPRRYVDDGDGGLYMCTWPKDDRPDPFILYAIEVWTGIEYSTAGLMVHEGMIHEAREIVRIARARYDGRPRHNQDSGGGVCGMGNPFQELECGKFYARAMSSWGLLIACQGLVLDGPQGVLGFRPRWQPDDHRSFFTVPEGWGLFVQRTGNGVQHERIELRHGRGRFTELVFETPEGMTAERVSASVGGRELEAQVALHGRDVRIVLGAPLVLEEGDALEVTLQLQQA